MKIYKDGIFKTISPSEFGIYQAAGFKKVYEGNVGEVKPNKKATKTEPIVVEPEEKEEPVIEEKTEPLIVEEEVEEEPQVNNKKGKNKNK